MHAFSFEDLKSSNPGKQVTCLDYLKITMGNGGLHPDMLRCFLDLLHPKFRLFEGRVYVDWDFDERRLADLHGQGHSIAASQFWMNLIGLTDLLEIEFEHVKSIGMLIADSWNQKLMNEFPMTTELARTVVDDDVGEVYVVISSA
jgi:hypothetical protein